VILHEPLDVKKYKQDLATSKLAYNMALVRFDENSLEGALDVTSKRSIVIASKKLNPVLFCS